MKRPPSSLTVPALRLIALAFLRRLGEEHRFDRIRVEFNPRMRTAIGRADPARARIYLNPHLLDRYPRELVPTIVHELCHLLAGFRAGHGPRWKELMRRCGFVPSSYHDLDVSMVQRERRIWRWRCRGCGVAYLRRHRGARRYRCGRCGSSLAVVGEARRVARDARPGKG